MRFFIPVLIALAIVGKPSDAQTPPPPQPKINITVSAGSGTITVSGDVTLPAGWTLSIHTLTIRHQKSTGGSTLNALMPVKGGKFKSSLNMTAGSYSVWGVIDVKDAEGREKQISSEVQSAVVS